MMYFVADTHGADIRVPKSCTTLIHVGDYVGGHIDAPKDCTLILVRGNHDTEITDYSYFNVVVDGLLVNNMWITHEPAFTLPLGAHMNVHGHLHDNPYEDYGYVKKSFHYLLEPKRMYSMGEICGHKHS
jgi:predicted phosphodiesterase